MSILLHIDHASPHPVYEQIRHQVHAHIETGNLKPGDRLPPVRQLANDLATTPTTVARAYRELEADGVLQGQGRRGSVITHRRAMLSHAERTRRLNEAANVFAATARSLGVSYEEALQALKDIWQSAHQEV